MSPVTFELVQALSLSQLRRVTAFVNELPDAAWSVQSACGEWEVGDVIAHLTGAADMWAGLLPAMATGGQAPKAWALPDPSRQGSTADDSKGLRRRLGDAALRQQFALHTARLGEAVRGLTPRDSDKTSPAARGGRTTVRDTLSVIVGETAFHQWDMESRVRPEAHLPRETFPVLTGYLAGWRTFGFRRSPPHPPVHYRWELSEETPAPERWDIVVAGDSFRHERNPAHDPDVVFRTDPESYILIGMGRLDLLAALKAGRVEARGPRQAIEAYPRYFASM